MLFVLLRLAGPAMLEGEPLPKIALRNAFRDLTFALALGMEQAPDGSGRVFVLEQDGIISVVSGNEDGFASSDFLNISDRKPHTSTEDGLLGLAFHPGFRTNQLFYIYYTQFEPRRSVVSEFRVSDSDPGKADPKSERIVMEVPQPFENHKAGQIKFGPDGYL